MQQVGGRRERPSPVDPLWRDHAACAGYPLHWWFPERGERAHEARAICNGCPVRVDCLAAALIEHTVFGIRGGWALGHERSRRKASQWLAGQLQLTHDRADTKRAS